MSLAAEDDGAGVLPPPPPLQADSKVSIRTAIKNRNNETTSFFEAEYSVCSVQGCGVVRGIRKTDPHPMPGNRLLVYRQFQRARQRR